ncbi:peptidase S8/S53 domain-containing protein [Alternaria rosae]|uniref:peptidase S8/S53 domain-containing protein n=1 Tax=Alternaria rosae TaxID=1187941 RepID=UPI001E8DAEF1|nr:peptidase S8/S53 domain-containing protein [Alternaria rosae]KAH6883067.1 peptidase S8/S53 domain-containing protein [Alternaria rosae]
MPISGDWENAMWLILEDIKKNDRAARSVVTTSMALGKDMTAEEAKDNEQTQKLYGNDLRELSNLGVPFVASAGNDAKDPKRKLVDQIPMLLSGDDIPLIIVGASDYDGKQADSSQAGPLVTIHAPGVDVECQTKVDEESAFVKGASIAAPQVAGLIATYLSYATKPSDDTKTGVERVKAIRDYLTSEKSSWVRDRDNPNSGIRVIWNGADAAAHGDDGDDDSPNDSDPPPSSPVPSPTPSRKNKTLSIIFRKYEEQVYRENSWLFFKGDYGTSSVCRPDMEATRTVLVGGDGYVVDNPPWPGGTYEMDDLIDGVNCDYLNDGTTPGSLWCQDWDAESEGPLPKDLEIQCKEEEVRSRSGAEVCPPGPLMFIEHHAVVTCDW